MNNRYRLAVVMPFAAALLLPACGQKSEPQSQIEPSRLEHVEGSEFARVVLTPRAAERIGIKTSAVRAESEQAQVALNDVSALGSGASLPASDATTAEAAEFVALTALIAAEAQVVDGTTSSGAGGGPASGLTVNDVPAEPLGRNKMQMAVPYSAVLYDSNGNTWVYTNPEPLVFVRHPISIDYIKGDLAVLSEGLPAATAVVTVGVAELYGTEFEVGH